MRLTHKGIDYIRPQVDERPSIIPDLSAVVTAVRLDPEASTRAELGQAVWEAHQHMSAREIRQYVRGVLREIKQDAPSRRA